MLHYGLGTTGEDIAKGSTVGSFSVIYNDDKLGDVKRNSSLCSLQVPLCFLFFLVSAQK